VRNKARLVAQGFSQVEGLDFGETFTPITYLEAIRILLAFAAFLNGVIQDEVYIRQPLGLENLKYPNRVYKLSKAVRIYASTTGMVC
jgi:hypothetical protein